MKKILALTLISAMVLSMTACGSKDAVATEEAVTEEALTEEAATEETVVEEEATTEEVTGGQLVMATNAEFPPYEYYDGDAIVGIDADFALAIADKLGMELKIEDMAFDSIITAVQGGKADFGAAGMTVTEERATQVDFADSYYTGRQVIIVNK